MRSGHCQSILIRPSAADNGFSFLPTLATLADGDEKWSQATGLLGEITRFAWVCTDISRICSSIPGADTGPCLDFNSDTTLGAYLAVTDDKPGAIGQPNTRLPFG